MMKNKIITSMIVIILLILLIPFPVPFGGKGGTIEYRVLTYSVPPKITLKEVIELSKKGRNLTFYDFEDNFFHQDIGIGIVSEKYEINKDYYLIVEGTSIYPTNIKLVYTSTSKEIDIRKEDVENFIENNKKFIGK